MLNPWHIILNNIAAECLCLIEAHYINYTNPHFPALHIMKRMLMLGTIITESFSGTQYTSCTYIIYDKWRIYEPNVVPLCTIHISSFEQGALIILLPLFVNLHPCHWGEGKALVTMPINLPLQSQSNHWPLLDLLSELSWAVLQLIWEHYYKNAQ